MNTRRLNAVRSWRGLFAAAGVCMLPVAQLASAQGSDDQYDVTVTYNATSKLFLPSSWNFPIVEGPSIIVFPTNLTSTQSAMTE